MPSQDWLPGFRAALQAVLLDKGTLVESHSTYGVSAWQPGQTHAGRYRSSRYREQDASVPAWCGGWQAISDLHEETWSEFQDTDADNLQTDILVATVTCNCGYITAERLEYRTTVSDLITSVLRTASGLPEEDSTVDINRRYGVEDYQRSPSPAAI